jgi:MraZ protein
MEQGSANPSARAFVRTMAASAHTDLIDKQGRINVPAHLREYAGITRECVVTGALDHGEIWSPERWDQVEAIAGDLDELAEQLNF